MLKRIALVAALTLATAAPAAAQFGTESDNFIAAVRGHDGAKAMELLNSAGPSLVNLRNTKGETPLIVAIDGHDAMWTGFLLNKGADPNMAGTNGDTPLLVAARIGFTDAVEWLLASGADVNAANRKGETPLIIAVQQRQAPIVRLLLSKGANPDQADHAAGLSARDYAKRDTRNRELLRLIETKKPAS